MRTLSNRLMVASALLLILAGLLWFGGNLYLSGKAQRVTVLRAAVDIPRGNVVSEAMLETAEVPRGQEGAYARSVADVVGKVARVDLVAGTPILLRMLADEPPPPGRILPGGRVLLPGRLAVAVPLDPLSAAGGALHAGDRVTLYATHPLTATAGVLPPLAEHVRVLDLFSGSGISLLSAPAERQADVVLLEADPPLADRIEEALRRGGVRLVLEGGGGTNE
ncbi:MAG: Flp pilus assembly protein CpaB [Chloroflexia bacterium]